VIQLTALGLVVLLGAACTGLFARRWLPAALATATVLQAGSVLDLSVGTAVFGVSPYVATVFVASLCIVPELWRDGVRGLVPGALRIPLALLAGYFLVAIAGALLLPPLFRGLPIYALIGPYGFGAATTPLAPGLSQLAQAANVLVHASAVLVLLHCRRQPQWRPAHLLAGWALGAVLVLWIGARERLALLGWLRSDALLWMNNPGYMQGHGAEVGGVLRISAPFSEPSYGSTLLAALFAGTCAIALFGRNARPASVAAALLGLGLLNSLGTTGIAAAVLGVSLLLALATLRARHGVAAPTVLGVRAILAWSAILLCVVTLWWGMHGSALREQLQPLIEQGVLEKLAGKESLSTTSRVASNLHAVTLLHDTAGLGVGLGGNRASSFLASLLSNVGLVGAGLFVFLLVLLVRRYARATVLDDAQLFALWSLLVATFAVTIGIPDLNLPLYWMLIFGALLLCPRAADYDDGRSADSS
jgi:hypothetical protein